MCNPEVFNRLSTTQFLYFDIIVLFWVHACHRSAKLNTSLVKLCVLKCIQITQPSFVSSWFFIQSIRKVVVCNGWIRFCTDLSSAPQMLMQMFTPIWYHGITMSLFTFYHSYLKVFLGTNALFGSNQQNDVRKATVSTSMKRNC